MASELTASLGSDSAMLCPFQLPFPSCDSWWGMVLVAEAGLQSHTPPYGQE